VIIVFESMRARVFITGSTGYMGSRLTSKLLQNGHTIAALTRPGSIRKLPVKCASVVGDALDQSSYSQFIPPAEAFVHLVGTSHPAPWKRAEFEAVDLVALREAVTAARSSGIRHFIYVSVAHPAPVMKAYIRVRCECEEILKRSGIPSTILRPWYVLGPGHRWPAALKPLYWLGERLAPASAGARRLGLVTIGEMVNTLAWAVENPASSWRVIEVPAIREIGRERQFTLAAAQ
jgi:nucleoside-diphosphate-sugar epimerase